MMGPRALRNIRKALGMTPAEFAKAAGVKPKQLLNWESSSGRKLPYKASIIVSFVNDLGKADLTNAKAE